MRFCSICNRDIDGNNENICSSCQSMSERVTQTININDVTTIEVREGDFFQTVNGLGWFEAFFDPSYLIQAVRSLQDRDLAERDANLEIIVDGETFVVNRSALFDELMDALPDLADCDC